MISLIRFCYSPFGTFGRLIFGDSFVYTLECPWLDNRPFESCIPEGIYQLEKNRSEKFNRDLYEVMGVKDRARILIHKGNTLIDIQGCICPANELGVLGIKWAVLNSASAFNRLYSYLDREENPSIQIAHKVGEGILK